MGLLLSPERPVNKRFNGLYRYDLWQTREHAEARLLARTSGGKFGVYKHYSANVGASSSMLYTGRVKASH